jgi:hypothetical protein
VGEVLNALGQLPGRAINVLSGLAGTMLTIGSDLIGGLVQGIVANAGRVLDAIRVYVLEKVPGPIRRFFGIDSPSKMFAGFGANMVAGLVQGISDGAPKIDGAIADLNQQFAGMTRTLPQPGIEGAFPWSIDTKSAPPGGGTVGAFPWSNAGAAGAGGSSAPVARDAAIDLGTLTDALAAFRVESAHASVAASTATDSQRAASVASTEIAGRLHELIGLLRSANLSGGDTIFTGGIHASTATDRQIATALPQAIRRQAHNSGARL